MYDASTSSTKTTSNSFSHSKIMLQQYRKYVIFQPSPFCSQGSMMSSISWCAFSNSLAQKGPTRPRFFCSWYIRRGMV